MTMILAKNARTTMQVSNLTRLQTDIEALNDRISNVRIVKRNGFTTIDLNNGKSIKFFPTNYDRMTKIIDNNCINDSIFKKPNNDTIIISHQNAYEYIIISKPQHLNYIQ